MLGLLRAQVKGFGGPGHDWLVRQWQVALIRHLSGNRSQRRSMSQQSCFLECYGFHVTPRMR